MSGLDLLRAELDEALSALDLEALAAAGVRRDPGSYNLIVHFLPPEVARDHAADEELRARLAAPTGPIGLYLHVPACTGRCTYCHYAVEPNPAPEALDAYLAALERELTTRWGKGRPGPVASVLVGGGTPTYLEADRLDRLLTVLHDTVEVPPSAEFTVESSPETLTEARLEVLLRHGVDRLNIGVQAFNDRLLRVLGRRHDAAAAEGAVRLAQRLGVPHVNLDLMYALPGQTLEDWVRSLDRAAAFGVASITTYHLRRRPDTSISRKASAPEPSLARQHLAAIRRLAAAGYRQSLVDNFVPAGVETAQVQARDKWRDMQPVDGCGLEACSRRPDVVAFDVATLPEYVAAVADTGGWPLAHGRVLSRPEQLAQRAMFALKVLDDDGGLRRDVFEAELCERVDDLFGPTVAELTALGLLADDGRTLRLTEAGTLFADEVCLRLYTDELRERMIERVRV